MCKRKQRVTATRMDLCHADSRCQGCARPPSRLLSQGWSHHVARPSRSALPVVPVVSEVKPTGAEPSVRHSSLWRGISNEGARELTLQTRTRFTVTGPTVARRATVHQRITRDPTLLWVIQSYEVVVEILWVVQSLRSQRALG